MPSVLPPMTMSCHYAFSSCPYALLNGVCIMLPSGDISMGPSLLWSSWSCPLNPGENPVIVLSSFAPYMSWCQTFKRCQLIIEAVYNMDLYMMLWYCIALQGADSAELSTVPLNTLYNLHGLFCFLFSWKHLLLHKP